MSGNYLRLVSEQNEFMGRLDAAIKLGATVEASDFEEWERSPEGADLRTLVVLDGMKQEIEGWKGQKPHESP